jgi:Ca-activated chloride channel family protein
VSRWRGRRAVLTVVAVPVCLGAGAAMASAQAAAAPSRVAIATPTADSYVSGVSALRAEVDPPAAVSNVVFFVDGRQTCEVAEAPFECAWDAGPQVAAHQVRLVVNLADGSRVVRTVRTKGLTFADNVDVDAVQVTVTVTDRETGKFVPELPREAFRISEDGRPQAISNFMSSDVPLELVVAVDVSGSMTSAMPKLKTAVKEFLAAVPARDQVTLLGFNDTVFTLTRKTTNPADRVRAVDRLAPWGATALYDVVLRSIDMIGRQVGRKAVVIFTDGEDQGSHVTIDDVERRLQSSDVMLYMIGQGRGITHESLRQVMQRLSTPTGGRAFSTDNIDELQSAFAELLDELSNQYLVGYQPTNTARDSAWREINVEVEGNYTVRARQGYRVVPLR